MNHEERREEQKCQSCCRTEASSSDEGRSIQTQSGDGPELQSIRAKSNPKRAWKFRSKYEYRQLLKDPRWQKKRLEILDRDQWTCVLCNSQDKTLNVHHESYREFPWETPNENLITLCEDCHEVITHLIKIARKANKKRKFRACELVELYLKAGDETKDDEEDWKFWFRVWCKIAKA